MSNSRPLKLIFYHILCVYLTCFYYLSYICILITDVYFEYRIHKAFQVIKRDIFLFLNFFQTVFSTKWDKALQALKTSN